MFYFTNKNRHSIILFHKSSTVKPHFYIIFVRLCLCEDNFILYFHLQDIMNTIPEQIAISKDMLHNSYHLSPRGIFLFAQQKCITT